MAPRLKLLVGKLSSRDTGKLHSESEMIAEMTESFKELQDIVYKVGLQLDGELTAECLLDALTPTYQKSQEYCPVKTGALKESGYLEVTNFRGSPRVEMGYAKGGEPWYAILVHEGDAYHKPPTRSHWLLAAVLEDADVIPARIAYSFRQAFGEAAS